VIINYKGGYNHDYDTFDDITDRDDNYWLEITGLWNLFLNRQQNVSYSFFTNVTPAAAAK
jgi:hypothetical protein